MEFIIVNGEILKYPEKGYLPLCNNDMFMLTYKIWFGFGGIPLFAENIENLEQIFELLRTPAPTFFADKRELYRIVKRMLNKNKFYRSGIISFNFYISKNKTDSIIQCQAFSEMEFPISAQGLLLNFSDTTVFSGNQLHRYSFFHQPQWQISEAEIQNTNWQNSIFLNENGAVTHCIGANIFGIKNKTLYIPSLETGRFTDPILKFVIEAASQAGLEVVQGENLNKDGLLSMKEIFIAGETIGIQWVMGVENKRYVQSFSPVINEKLNVILSRKVV